MVDRYKIIIVIIVLSISSFIFSIINKSVDFFVLLMFEIFVFFIFFLSVSIYEKKRKIITKDVLIKIVDSIPSQVYIRDVDGIVTFANKEHLNFLKVEYNDIINKKDIMVFSEEETKNFKNEDIDVINNRKMMIIPEEKVKINNENLYFKTVKQSVKLYNEKYYSLGISYNITELVNSRIEVDNKNEELSASMQQLEAYSQTINDINTELYNMLNKYNILIGAIGKIQSNEILSEDEFLKEIFNIVYNLIEESDYGSIYVYENDKIHFAHCIGHEKEKLNQLNLDKKIYSLTTETFKIVDFIEEKSMSNMTEENQIIFKSAIKKTKQSILIGLHFENKLIGGLSLDIDANSNKNFSEENGKVLLATTQLINSYFINNKYQSLKDSLLQETIKIVINVLNMHDEYTKDHSTNVADYSKVMAEEMQLTQLEISDVFITGLLHDIGKTFIPIKLLNKKGKLTEEEYNIMKTHSVKGYDILSKSYSLKKISKYVLYHHEWWNGNGYPEGIKKDEIPVTSQIIAVADAYDAMMTDRPYRKKFTKEYAINAIIENSGTQFSPVVVEAFKRIYGNFNE
jgi:HD-GYP domain-containing protein (c-di-GMP phosphodiesterase class II)